MTRLQIVGAAFTVAVAGSLAACNVTAPAKPADAPKADTGKIADAIKADVAQGVADFNARDADKASAHDAPDVVFMFHGAPNVVGADANLAATKQADAADKTAHVAVSNESVDVPASGDMAVYHSTYNVSFTDPKTKKPGTDQGNYLAGYKLQADGTWKIEWVVISNTPPAPGTPPAKPMAAKSPGGGQDNGQHSATSPGGGQDNGQH